MTKQTVGTYMSASPHSIGHDQMLAEAHKVMRKWKIRHLPVLSGGKLVGVVTERDLHLVETLRDVNPARVPIEEAMTQEVFTVSAETPLEEAAGVMVERKLGSAVVMDHGKVVGVLTTIDALRALVDLLQESRKSDRGPRAAAP